MRILYNARIHTLDPRQPVVSAMAIDGQRILATGSDAEMLALATPLTLTENMGGSIILPGLTDAHVHLQIYAFSLQNVDAETPTRAECLRRVAQRAMNTRPGEWIRGHGWNQNVWPEGFGNRQDLDAVAPNNPVYMTDKSVHAAWVNTAALKILGITAATPDPAGGIIQRDVRGEPTGILFEAAAFDLWSSVPGPSPEQIRAAIFAAQNKLFSLGLTGVHDFDRRPCFTALQELNRDDRLRLRVLKSIPLDHLDEAVELGLQTGFGNDTLRIGPVKLFADGALGPQTAAMFQPYEGNPQNSGTLLLDSEQVMEYGRKAAQSRLSLAIHAIGDRTNHEMLNGLEHLRAYEAENRLPFLRHRIEHVQCIHPQDERRLSQMGIIASMQPQHATSDMFTADHHWGKRGEQAYVFRTLMESGATLAFGSDAPVEVPNPFWGMHAAVTRRRQNGDPSDKGWYPRQRLSILDALHGYTTGPAFAAGQEKHLGRLAPGFLADLIVLDEDPFAVEPQRIFTLAPKATMVGNEWVWRL